MKIKRWLFLLVLSAVIALTGISRLLGNWLSGYRIPIVPEIYIEQAREHLIRLKFIDFVAILFGMVGVWWAFKRLVRTFSMAFLPEQSEHLADLTYKRLTLRSGPKVVVVGGGTGMPSVLEGLKEYTSNITAIVTVADDGGSSGRLREVFKMPAPGDIRNCLVALADAGPIMNDLFQYRFKKDPALDGHSFGNLFITAMTDLTGDFDRAVRESSRVLAIRGQVVPVTLDHVTLKAELTDRSVVSGETSISKSVVRIQRVSLDPPTVRPNPEALEAIRQAEMIVIGPGSLYTSLIPNILVPGVADAIAKNTGVKVVICNMMTQPGETTGYSVTDHIQALVEHGNSKMFEYVVVNMEPLAPKVAERYAAEHADAVVLDETALRSRTYSIVKAKVLSQDEYVRHDPVKLARVLMKVLSL